MIAVILVALLIAAGILVWQLARDAEQQGHTRGWWI